MLLHYLTMFERLHPLAYYIKWAVYTIFKSQVSALVSLDITFPGTIRVFRTMSRVLTLFQLKYFDREGRTEFTLHTLHLNCCLNSHIPEGPRLLPLHIVMYQHHFRILLLSLRKYA